MQNRGAGIHTGREESMTRSHARRALEDALARYPFPAERDALRDWGRTVTAIQAPNGDLWTVADMLQDVPVERFSSPRHVAEVVALRWQDMADVFRPGGLGPSGPYGPREATKK